LLLSLGLNISEENSGLLGFNGPGPMSGLDLLKNLPNKPPP